MATWEKTMAPFGVETTYSELAGMLGLKKATIASAASAYGLEETLAKKRIGNASTLKARLDEYRHTINEESSKVVEAVFGGKDAVELAIEQSNAKNAPAEPVSEPVEPHDEVVECVDETPVETVFEASESTTEAIYEEPAEKPVAPLWKRQLATLNALIEQTKAADAVLREVDEYLFLNIIDKLEELREYEFSKHATIDWEELAK